MYKKYFRIDTKVRLWCQHDAIASEIQQEEVVTCKQILAFGLNFNRFLLGLRYLGLKTKRRHIAKVSGVLGV